MHAATWQGNTFPDCLEIKGTMPSENIFRACHPLQIKQLVVSRGGDGNAFIQLNLGQERPFDAVGSRRLFIAVSSSSPDRAVAIVGACGERVGISGSDAYDNCGPDCDSG
jgi:hypothetical protein